MSNELWPSAEKTGQGSGQKPPTLAVFDCVEDATGHLFSPLAGLKSKANGCGHGRDRWDGDKMMGKEWRRTGAAIMAVI